MRLKLSNKTPESSGTTSISIFMRPSQIAREEKVFSRFLNKIGFKTMFSQDVMESILKKEVLSDKYQQYKLPKFKVVFTKSNQKKTK